MKEFLAIAARWMPNVCEAEVPLSPGPQPGGKRWRHEPSMAEEIRERESLRMKIEAEAYNPPSPPRFYNPPRKKKKKKKRAAADFCPRPASIPAPNPDPIPLHKFAWPPPPPKPLTEEQRENIRKAETMIALAEAEKVKAQAQILGNFQYEDVIDSFVKIHELDRMIHELQSVIKSIT